MPHGMAVRTFSLTEEELRDPAEAQVREVWGDQCVSRLSVDGAMIDSIREEMGAGAEVKGSTVKGQEAVVINGFPHYPFSGWASTEAVDSYGDVVTAKGWLLQRFRKNGPMLWAHNHYNAPIGRLAVQTKEGEGLWVTRGLLQDSAYTNSLGIVESFLAGNVKGMSVGFRPKEYEPIDKDKPWQGLRFLKQELLEVSLCGVPANPETLAQRTVALRGLVQIPEVPWTVEDLASQVAAKIRADVAASAEALAPLQVSVVTDKETGPSNDEETPGETPAAVEPSMGIRSLDYFDEVTLPEEGEVCLSAVDLPEGTDLSVYGGLHLLTPREGEKEIRGAYRLPVLALVVGDGEQKAPRLVLDMAGLQLAMGRVYHAKGGLLLQEQEAALPILRALYHRAGLLAPMVVSEDGETKAAPAGTPWAEIKFTAQEERVVGLWRFGCDLIQVTSYARHLAKQEEALPEEVALVLTHALEALQTLQAPTDQGGESDPAETALRVAQAQEALRRWSGDLKEAGVNPREYLQTLGINLDADSLDLSEIERAMTQWYRERFAAL